MGGAGDEEWLKDPRRAARCYGAPAALLVLGLWVWGRGTPIPFPPGVILGFQPACIAAGPAGEVYVGGDTGIWRVQEGRPPVRVAGAAWGTPPEDAGPAVGADLKVSSLACGPDGSLFLADESKHRVFRIDSAGRLVLVAGCGLGGEGAEGMYDYTPDGTPARQARFPGPRGLAVDERGNVLFSTSERVRRVGASGAIDSVGPRDYRRGGRRWDDDTGRVSPWELAIGAHGGLYLVDDDAHVRKIDARGEIAIVAGSGKHGYSGDGGPAVRAGCWPMAVAASADGTFFIADPDNLRVRRVDTRGIISTVAGTGTKGPSGDGGPAALARLDGPWGVAVSPAGELYILDGDRVRKVDRAGIIRTVVTVVPHRLPLE